MSNKTDNYFIKCEDFLDVGQDTNVYWMDKQGHLVNFNQAQFQLLADMTGITSREEMKGKHIGELLSEDETAMVLEENSLVMNTKKAHLFLNRVLFKNYRVITYLTIKTPMYNEKNEIVGIWGVSVSLSVYPPAKINDIQKLTRREYQCLSYLVRGSTAKEIAEKLHVSKRTIESYIVSIKSKLNCYSKSALINKVFEIGFESIANKMDVSSEQFSPGHFISSIDESE